MLSQFQTLKNRSSGVLSPQYKQRLTSIVGKKRDGAGVESGFIYYYLRCTSSATIVMIKDNTKPLSNEVRRW